MIAGVAVAYVIASAALDSAVAPVPDVPPRTLIVYESRAAPVTASAHVADASDPRRRIVATSGATVSDVPTAAGRRSVTM